MTYPGGLGNRVRAYCLAAREDGQLEADGGQADVEVDVEDADDDELPTRGLLGQQRLLLEAGEEFVLVEDIAGVFRCRSAWVEAGLGARGDMILGAKERTVPQHGQPDPLVLGEGGAQVSLGEARGPLGDRRGCKGFDLWGVEGLVGDGAPRLDRLVGIGGIVDGSDGLRSRRRRLVSRRQNGRVRLGEEGRSLHGVGRHRRRFYRGTTRSQA